MLPEVHRVVNHVDDGLRATSCISRQHTVAKGWSVDLTTQATCTVEEPIKMSRHCQRTASRSWSVGRDESFVPRGTLHSMCAVASQPLSPCALPPEVRSARGRTHQRHRFAFDKVRFEIVPERVNNGTPDPLGPAEPALNDCGRRAGLGI